MHKTKMNKTSNKLKTFFTNYPWTSRISLFFISLIIILIIVRIILTPVIIHLTASWLEDQGIESSIEDIRLNLIKGTVELTEAKGTRQGKPLYEVGSITIFWSWTPLSDKMLVINAFNINHLDVHIKNYTDEIIIGGVHIPISPEPGETNAIEKSDSGQKNEAGNKKPWAASLGKVVFSDLNICYLQHTATLANANKTNLLMDYCVNLEEMQWAGTIGYATNAELIKTAAVPISTSGDFSLTGLTITDNKLNKILLESKTSTLDKVTTNGPKNIKLGSLTMHDLSIMQRDDEKYKDSLRFDSLDLNNITFKNLNDVSIDSFTLNSPGIYFVKNKNKTWEYEQWIPNTTSSNKSDAEKTQKQPATQTTASAFKFSIKQIEIDDADLCFYNKATTLYYCYTQETLSWSGPIIYDESKKAQPPIALNGDLKLFRSTIINHTLNRQLAGFEQLDIKKLAVNGQKVIAADFAIKKLAALQRGKKASDNTIAFDSLALKAIDYSPEALSIKSISINDLTQNVSKNKNGLWEHDKWFIEPNKQNKAAKKKQGAEANTKSTNEKTEQPFNIAISKIIIDTKKPISYTDNSTSPSFTAGFTQLYFSLSGLDSKKPEQNSPLKLAAKTTRYATIDIEGTIQPLADKISFDAEGKIRGADLRALTPITRKEIGHIIKNGQLDADLTLLATKGILDSNIDLTLYKFEIKSIDKADAEELDAELGMPLNQTLSLLRDKKNNIHLNIPITGDLENPSFDPMNAIVTATSKAATQSLVTYFTPYGLIYAGGNLAFDLATALHFDPILFESGKSNIESNDEKQLDDLAVLLKEKPQVHLTLCGVTNRQDTFALFPDIKEQYNTEKTVKEDTDEDESKKSLEITLTKEQLVALNTLARKRQINSKQYLVEQRDIAHDRLILCVPKHQTDDDEISGVEVNI